MVLYLKPTSYAKRQKAEDIHSCLLSAPTQIPNSPDAFNSKVMEFTLSSGKIGEPVAQEFPETDTYLIRCAERKILLVQRLGSNFIPKSIIEPEDSNGF